MSGQVTRKSLPNLTETDVFEIASIIQDDMMANFEGQHLTGGMILEMKNHIETVLDQELGRRRGFPLPVIGGDNV